MGVPIVLDGNGNTDAVLKGSYDIVVKSEMLSRTNGYETLTFSIPFSAVDRDKLTNEKNIEVDGRVYVVKMVDDTKSNSKICSVTCDALWYDLADGDLKTHTSTRKVSAKQAIDEQLEGTGWTSGIIEVEVPHKFTISEANTVLYNLRYINSVFGGDMWFDTKNKTVNLYNQLGKRTQNIFSYRKNMQEIKRVTDTRNIITRYKLVGEGGITVAQINNGLDYVENYSYYDSVGIQRAVKYYEEKDERFSNVQYMLWYMNEWIAKYCKPITTYTVSISVLDNDTQIGDYVYVMDEELGIQEWLRVVKMDKNINEPWKGSVVLDELNKDLSDTMNSSSSTYEEQQYVEQKMNELSPYNLLLNSRADQGMSYWTGTGYYRDTEHYGTGKYSFASYDGAGEKRLSQTIYPGNRDAFSVSAKVWLDDGYAYTQGDKVGIEVVIEYEDGSTQTEFISVFDEVGDDDV